MVLINRFSHCTIFLFVFSNTSNAWIHGRLISRSLDRCTLDAAVLNPLECVNEKPRRASTSLRWVDDKIISDPSSSSDNEAFDDDISTIIMPDPKLSPEEIPALLMQALKRNDFPEVDSGLRTMWEFAGGNTRYVFKHNITEYIESAHETADQLPTSFYGVAMNGKEWTIETEINRVGGEEGWIATQLMKTISSDGRMRRWQWELRKNKRPPYLGCWMVEAIASSDRKGEFEVE